MMNILYEQPGTILIIGVIAEVIALGGLMKTGRKEALVAAIVIPLVGIALLGLERYVVTDREEVRETIQALARAVEDNDLPRILAQMSDRYPEGKQEAEAEFPRYEFGEVDVKSNLKIEVQEENVPPKATATFNVTVVVSDRRGIIVDRKFPFFVELTFYKEEGQWKVAKYAYSDAMRGMGGGP